MLLVATARHWRASKAYGRGKSCTDEVSSRIIASEPNLLTVILRTEPQDRARGTRFYRLGVKRTKVSTSAFSSSVVDSLTETMKISCGGGCGARGDRLALVLF